MLSFIVWAAWHSLRHPAGWTYFPDPNTSYSADSAGGSLRFNQRKVRCSPQGPWYSFRRTGAMKLTRSSKFGADSGSLFSPMGIKHTSEPVAYFVGRVNAMGRPLNAPVIEQDLLLVPYWAIALLFIVPWSAFLAWRRRRMRRVPQELAVQ